MTLSSPQQHLALADAPASAMTPLMSQYLGLKEQYPDVLLFFRLGDFYELFFADAVQAAAILDIALTRRGQHQGADIPMCGVPAHAYEAYLAKLIRHGCRVAIAEQMEDPATAKKRGHKAIVKRDVVRIITPGTVTEDGLLESRQANHLLTLAGSGEQLAAAWLDLAAARPQTQSITPATLPALLERLQPSEIVLPDGLATTLQLALESWRHALTPLPSSRFDSTNAAKQLHSRYGVTTLAAFGDFNRAEIAALGALLDYTSLTQRGTLQHLAPPQQQNSHDFMQIDAATARNLELTRTLQGGRKGTLLDTIDATITGAGARLLAQWLAAPLCDKAAIETRLDAVEYGVQHHDLAKVVRENLRQTPDIERALSRIALGRGSPRDLASLRDALGAASTIQSALVALPRDEMPILWQTIIHGIGHEATDHSGLQDQLSRALQPELPYLARDGGFIARHYSPALDELLTLRDDSQRLILGLQQRYAAASGISNLKIKHNNVIGYHIDVTPQHGDTLLAQSELFIHRQTLANSCRFTTVELGELAGRINEAAGRAVALELQLFAELNEAVLARLEPLRTTAQALALLDCVLGLATIARQHKLCRPTITTATEFNIIAGRHPVVARMMGKGAEANDFIPNDCDLSATQHLWLLTGPNMAGKSTFLRQNALIAILAQLGSFVPATAATIGVIDRLFSRVGAADDLARGRSTFMVEMVETAAILHQATARSLVILDEIGRGTATYDGMALAAAVIEHLHDHTRARALFATHYHELTHLAERLPALHCATMKIKEWQQDIIFMHEVVAGVADRSYGIHVAKLAGLPPAVLARAENLLQELEARHGKPPSHNAAISNDSAAILRQAPATMPPIALSSPALDYLATLSPDSLSPKQALDALYELKKLSSAL